MDADLFLDIGAYQSFGEHFLQRTFMQMYLPILPGE